jgi:AraC-like DNA-binding protein
MPTSSEPHLLDRFPLFRSRSADEASALTGNVFSPHRLAMRGHSSDLEVRHNRVRLSQVGINVLAYGAEVDIDPGERGDFYMLLLPLQGQAITECNGRSVVLDDGAMGVLHPRQLTRMNWSTDCEMLLLEVPRQLLEEVVGAAPHSPDGGLTLALPRATPSVAAWWQSALDMTHSLHHFGEQWLAQPRMQEAMEGFLVTGLRMLFNEPNSMPSSLAPLSANCHRALARAMDYIQAHASDRLTVADIANAACVSPRTLEAAFRRRYDQSPLAYVRGVQLDRVHESLRRAHLSQRGVQVTDIAMENGFTHMGRFAGYYKKRFGNTPTQTLKGG